MFWTKTIYDVGFAEIGEARRTLVLRSLSRKMVYIYKNEDFFFLKVFSEIDFGHL
jgi:hypothetical protein